MQKYFTLFILFVLSLSLKAQSGGLGCDNEFGPWLCLDPIVITAKPKPKPTPPIVWPGSPIVPPIPPRTGVSDSGKTPCPGTPMQKPKIAPSGGWNVKGGTYGYTRAGGKQFHDGIDIAGTPGTNIYSMYEGVVTRIDKSFSPGQYMKQSYGNFIQITSTVDGKKVSLKYNHLDSVSKYNVGDVISQGVIIGTIGTTGNAAAKDVPVVPHVHIQAKDEKGNRTDPAKYLKGKIDFETGNINITKCN